jgi:hypothetical protein
MDSPLKQFGVWIYRMINWFLILGGGTLFICARYNPDPGPTFVMGLFWGAMFVVAIWISWVSRLR